MLGVDSLCFPRKKKHLPRSICLTKHWNIKLQRYRLFILLSTLLVAWASRRQLLRAIVYCIRKDVNIKAIFAVMITTWVRKVIMFCCDWWVLKAYVLQGNQNSAVELLRKVSFFRKITDTAIFCRFQTCPKGFQYPPAGKKLISSFYNCCSYRWST